MSRQLSDREFEVLIWENQDQIYKVCAVFARSQADRDDLFQEITLNLWKGLDSFLGHSRLSTWIYRVSINTAINRVRKQKNNRIDYRAEVPEIVPEEQEQSKEPLFEALYQGINELKPPEKAIILLYLEEKSYEEIAEIMGLSKSNVSVKLVRLKRKLGKIIEPILAKNS